MNQNVIPRLVSILFTCVGCAFPMSSLDEITVGATYRMNLTTGDALEGIVDSKNDTSLILDCKGSAYTFAAALIAEYTLLAPPAQKTPLQPAAVAARDTAPSAATAPPQVYDTMYVKNSETDEYGKPKPDVLVVGKILRDDKAGVSIMLPDNQTMQYSFDQIARIFRHSTEDSEEDHIKAYAKPLFCPPDMVLVDLPPGKANRPFFKVCIDKYEYPDREGVVPQVNISFDDAQRACEKTGKRLCTAEEWRWACSGLEAYKYPYGNMFEKDNCNIDGGRAVEPSGNRNKCISKFGAFDMAGNVFEWVRAKDNRPAAMGGPLSKCQTVSGGGSGDPQPGTGLRCCKSN
jgi:Sulfatase-modifying factor enzyme 1